MSPAKKTKRAALYLRVSTKKQTNENQRGSVEQLAAHRGYEVVATFEEQASATSKKRPAWEAMKAAAHRGEFDVLVVWAVDRIGRSMHKNLAEIVELDSKGIEIVSVQEGWLDMAGPTRSLLVAIFSWVAEQEHHRISERIGEGQQRAKREGKHIGRPKASLDLPKARAMRAQGSSIREIAAKLKTSPATIHRALGGAA